MLRNRTIAYFTALSLGFSGALSAKVSPEEAARLGEDLTPLGAIQAGNEEGTIPAWEGGLTQPPSGYSEGTHHMDPFPDDKPLFTITAENFDEYKDFLTPGQIRMFERYPNTWRLPIYETRRTAAFPEYVYEAVKANALTAELNPSGNGVVSASVGPAFPIPQEGLHEK